MSRKHKAKPGYLGRAFYEWLAWLEFTERSVLGKRMTGADKKRMARGRGYSFNNDLFPNRPSSPILMVNDTEVLSETIESMLPIDAYLAHLVRSSVKFRINVDTLARIQHEYPQELIAISKRIEINLPFETCTVCFEQDDEHENDILVNIAEVTASDRDPRAKELFELKQYPQLGIEAGEKFISASMCFYRDSGVESNYQKVPSQKLSHCPVEIHFNKGRRINDTVFLNAIAPGTNVSERGKAVLDGIQNMLVAWLCTFELQADLRRRQPGIPATSMDLPQRPPHRPRKKFERPMYEHFVIEMEIDKPDDMQTGTTRMPHHKRQHMVRGFPRHHKIPIKHGPNKGKTVTWVKPHWRGNAELGVVQNDYEMTTHEDPK